MIYVASKKSALFHDETFRVFKRKSYFKSKTYMVHCAIWYHLYYLKKREKHHAGVLI